jgi:hypothetical protein
MVVKRHQETFKPVTMGRIGAAGRYRVSLCWMCLSVTQRARMPSQQTISPSSPLTRSAACSVSSTTTPIRRGIYKRAGAINLAGGGAQRPGEDYASTRKMSTTDRTFGPYERRLLAPKTQDSIYLFTAMLRASSGRGSECIPRPRLRRGIALLCGTGESRS